MSAVFRTILIVAATMLAGGGTALSYFIPIKADMKQPTQILLGLGLFFILFFAAVRLIDDYVWWAIPALAFCGVLAFGFRRLDDIKRLIDREKPNKWLTQTAASLSPTAAPEATMRNYETIEDLDFEGLLEPEDDELPRPRRLLDDFVIADEAETWPTELELGRLDEFIFAARHGYLVHDRGVTWLALCDVMTIHPGMSIADLIDAAKLHDCVTEVAE